MKIREKSKISKFDVCFELHATEEVKVAVEGAGEYHKFIIGKAFREESDQVTDHDREHMRQIRISQKKEELSNLLSQIVFESSCLGNETEAYECDHDHAWVLTSLFSYDSVDMYDFCTKHLGMKSRECGAKKFK